MSNEDKIQGMLGPMQALADFAEQDPSLRSRVLKLLEKCARAGTPAMKSRGRKLRVELNPLRVS